MSQEPRCSKCSYLATRTSPWLGFALSLGLIISGGCNQESPAKDQTPDANVWRLTYEQSGGIAGFRLSAEVESNGSATFSDPRRGRTVQVQLPAVALNELSGLLASARFFSQPPNQGTPGCRDCITYRISMTESGKTHTVEGDDQGMAPELRPLVAWLSEHTGRALQGP